MCDEAAGFGLLLQEAPVMITGKRKVFFFFSFLMGLLGMQAGTGGSRAEDPRAGPPIP